MRAAVPSAERERQANAVGEALFTKYDYEERVVVVARSVWTGRREIGGF